MNQNMDLFHQNFNYQQIDKYSAVTKKKYRNKFTPQEDEQLKELVNQYGVHGPLFLHTYQTAVLDNVARDGSIICHAIPQNQIKNGQMKKTR